MEFPGWLHAGFWGWVSGSALLIGAAIGYKTKLSQRLIASIMAFGSGVLISALTLELMEVAYDRGGFLSTAIGFVAGSIVYTAANAYLAARGAKHRKRSQGRQPSESEATGSGAAIAVGSLLDGIPESIVIGLSLISGGRVSMVAVVAIFLSNIPEGLSSASGMKRAGRSALYVFGLWSAVLLVSGGASILGYAVFRNYSAGVIAATMSTAAGAMLTMLADTMIPEAFEHAHGMAGLITVLGFLASFILSKID